VILGYLLYDIIGVKIYHRLAFFYLLNYFMVGQALKWN